MANIYDFEDTQTTDASNPLEDKGMRKKERESCSPAELARGRRTMYQMVEIAFQTLEGAMKSSDWPTAVKAALGLLDRAGFGPKSHVDVTTTTVDLSALSREELAERAVKVAELLRGRVSTVKPIDIHGSSTVN